MRTLIPVKIGLLRAQTLISINISTEITDHRVNMTLLPTASCNSTIAILSTAIRRDDLRHHDSTVGLIKAATGGIDQRESRIARAIHRLDLAKSTDERRDAARNERDQALRAGRRTPWSDRPYPSIIASQIRNCTARQNPKSNKIPRMSLLSSRTIGKGTQGMRAAAMAMALLVPTAVATAQDVRTVERSAQGPSAKDIRIGVYLNVQPDCTSGTLPAIRLLTPPANGTVNVKRGKITATNYKQCMALEVPGFIAFYRSKADFVGTDVVTLEVKYPQGRTEVQRITVKVGGTGSGGRDI